MITQIKPESLLWHQLLNHLERIDMKRWSGLDDKNHPLPDVFFIGAVEDNQVVGHISIKRQQLSVPATEWSDGKVSSLQTEDGVLLHETFVQTFAVDGAHRRKGLGRALQQSALQLSETLGVYQMRSWSSLDKPANYALKLSMGFCVHPAISEADSGVKISGVFFVKCLR